MATLNRGARQRIGAHLLAEHAAELELDELYRGRWPGRGPAPARAAALAELHLGLLAQPLDMRYLLRSAPRLELP